MHLVFEAKDLGFAPHVTADGLGALEGGSGLGCLAMAASRWSSTSRGLARARRGKAEFRKDAFGVFAQPRSAAPWGDPRVPEMERRPY